MRTKNKFGWGLLLALLILLSLLPAAWAGEEEEPLDLIEEVEPALLSVRFETFGFGEAPETQDVYWGDLAYMPEEPEQEALVFTGWYLDSAFETPYDFGEAVTEDLTLYAGWTHEHEEEPLSFWLEGDSLPEEAGSYFLGVDVVLRDPWQVPGELTELCLMGHSVRLAEDSEAKYAVAVPAEVTLNLCDCLDTGSVQGLYIPEGAACAMSGGTVCFAEPGVLLDGGKFHMSGGTVTSNRDSGVRVESGSFYLTGGSISENIEAEHGGVYLVDGDLYLSETPTIAGNTVEENGEARDVLLAGGKINADPELEAEIGVSAETPPAWDSPVVVASGAGEALLDCFFSEDERFELQYSDGLLTLNTASECAVSFDTGGGSEIAPQKAAVGQALSRPADPTREGSVFAGWYGDQELTQSWDFDNAPVNGPTTLYAAWVKAWAEVSLRENFRVDLYVELPDAADPAQYHIHTEFNARPLARTIDLDLSMAVKSGGCYVISNIAEVPSYQMTAPINITLTREGLPVWESVYCVRDYLKALASAKPAYAEFSHAALCYGGAAQRYYDGRTYTIDGVVYPYEVFLDDPADAGLAPLEPTIPTNGAAHTGLIYGLTDFWALMSFDSNPTLKLYFTSPYNPSALSFTTLDGRPVSGPVLEGSGLWSVSLTDIQASELPGDFVIIINYGSQFVFVQCSPYSYSAMQWNSENTKLSALCRAMVAYADAAALIP